MRFKYFLYPLTSGLATAAAVLFCLPLLGLISLVPLLFSLHNLSLKLYLSQVLIFSSVSAFFLFFWMLTSSTAFTGSFLYGLAGMLFSLILFTTFFTAVFLIWRKLCGSQLTWRSIVALSSLFAFFELVCDNTFKTLPWYNFHFGNPLIGSTYTIQFAELGGVYILTFLIFLINGGIAYSLKDKIQFKTIAIIISVFTVANVLLFNFRTVAESPETIVKMNLLNANVLPATNWEKQGNSIVPKIISLSKVTTSQNADFNVWTESVVPWTYSKGDDFLNAILDNASNSQTINLIGMNTAVDEYSVLNSAYAIKPDGTVLGRYDKMNPLSLMERPLISGLPIQFANNGFQVKPGASNKPILTNKGIVGVYICNEATIAPAVAELVINGAEYLVNISNDGWFKDTYIARQHFYYNRLRAVENRRDIAINSNCGYSGKASSNGEIQIIEQSDFPTIHQVLLYKSNTKTIYSFIRTSLF